MQVLSAYGHNVYVHYFHLLILVFSNPCEVAQIGLTNAENCTQCWRQGTILRGLEL